MRISTACVAILACWGLAAAGCISVEDRPTAPPTDAGGVDLADAAGGEAEPDEGASEDVPSIDTPDPEASDAADDAPDVSVQPDVSDPSDAPDDAPLDVAPDLPPADEGGPDAPPACEVVECTSSDECLQPPGQCTVAVCDPDTCSCEAQPAGQCQVDEDCPAPGAPCVIAVCDQCECADQADPSCAPCETAADCGPCAVCSAGGACQEVPASGSCLTDGACDDGDPCTADLCLNDACGGCVNKPLAGCEECQTAADCDDGDPCTDNLCYGEPSRFCYYPVKPQCIQCTSLGLTALGQAVELGPNVSLKVSGTAQPKLDPMQCSTCAEGDPGCCVECGGGLAFKDAFDHTLMLTTPDESWSCTGSTTPGCEEMTSCAPMYLGHEYYAWGQTLPPPDEVPPGAPPPDATMLVQGWCLAPTVTGLAGTWIGEIWGATDHESRTKATITLSNAGGELAGTIEETDIEESALFQLDESSAFEKVQLTDGTLQFDLSATVTILLIFKVPVTAHFVMHFDGNRAYGTWEAEGSSLGTSYTYPGYADFTRQP